jgi:hypothetical protein
MRQIPRQMVSQIRQTYAIGPIEYIISPSLYYNLNIKYKIAGHVKVEEVCTCRLLLPTVPS